MRNMGANGKNNDNQPVVIPVYSSDPPVGNYRDLGPVSLEITTDSADNDQDTLEFIKAEFRKLAKQKRANAIFSAEILRSHNASEARTAVIRGHAVHLYRKSRSFFTMYGPYLPEEPPKIFTYGEVVRLHKEQIRNGHIFGLCAPKLPSSSFPKRRPLTKPH